MDFQDLTQKLDAYVIENETHLSIMESLLTLKHNYFIAILSALVNNEIHYMDFVGSTIQQAADSIKNTQTLVYDNWKSIEYNMLSNFKEYVVNTIATKMKYSFVSVSVDDNSTITNQLKLRVAELLEDESIDITSIEPYILQHFSTSSANFNENKLNSTEIQSVLDGELSLWDAIKTKQINFVRSL